MDWKPDEGKREISFRRRAKYMPKPYREVVRIMKKNGWKYSHTTGSHEIYHHEDGRMCPVKCTKKDIPDGTLQKIRRITGQKF